MGCPTTGCVGYELSANLDFDTNGNGVADAGDAYWNGGAGWEPIGPYTATFAGNGHTLANLFIARSATDEVGLFSRLGTGSVVRNVGLRGVDVRGRNEVGGLVGDSDGTIRASYASGTVRGSNDVIGGLAGRNDGTITTSYVGGTVAGDDYVGGLTGINGSGGTITASYAGSEAIGAGGSGSHSNHGGLVGRNDGRGRISASYAWGRVTETHGTAGGLVGSQHGDSRVTASYWDTATSGQTRSAGGVGQTTSALQTPTDYSGIYADWNVDVDGVTGRRRPVALRHQPASTRCSRWTSTATGRRVGKSLGTSARRPVPRRWTTTPTTTG